MTVLIRQADEQLYQHMPEVQITDDAMVVETMLQTPVKLYEGSYNNIKITTPEDLVIAESFLHVQTAFLSAYVREKDTYIALLIEHVKKM